MATDIRLEQKELDDIINLRNQVYETVNEIGQLSVHASFLKAEIHDTNSEIDAKMDFYKELLLRERELTSYITSKYGEVYLDIESGIITPKE